MSTPSDIKVLCLDIDGVLTDGRLWLDQEGTELRTFHIRDGQGIRLWLNLGLDAIAISGRPLKSAEQRLTHLGMKHVQGGVDDKPAVLLEMLREIGAEPHEVAMLGDDLPDIPLARMVGYPMAVADACTELRELAQYTTATPGGFGAAREAIEHLLKSMRRWDEALATAGCADMEVPKAQ
ncbi:MAG: HAD hydrolase family protein [Phycisphaerales bacterium]|nr:HAD hydrolase family protein [Phycisphaerales bacterium]